MYLIKFTPNIVFRLKIASLLMTQLYGYLIMSLMESNFKPKNNFRGKLDPVSRRAHFLGASSRDHLIC